MPRQWEYLVTKPSLPPDATGPMMDSAQTAEWLNQMDERGWEFVGPGQVHWSSGYVQDWWVFRRPFTERLAQEKGNA